MLKHTGTIQIESERLILRKFVYSDIPHMLKNWIANPAVQNEYGEPAYKTVDDVHELLSKWIANYNNDNFYRWAIILKENNENIGQIAFCKVYTEIETAEIEYCIGENYVGKGFGKLLYSKLISELVSSGFHTAIGGIALPNEASVRLHESLGFKQVAQFQEVGNKFGRWIDVGFWQVML